MAQSPGLALLVAILPKLSLPPLIVYSLSLLAAKTHAVDLSPGITTLACVLSLPVSMLLRRVRTVLVRRREMREMGAVPVPVVQGEWPGNLDVLFILLHNWRYGYPGDGFQEQADKYGPTFNLRVLGEDRIMTVEPDNIKTVLATDFNNYEKGDKFIASMNDLLGVGVFNSDGDMWKFHRGLTRPYFNRERITDFETFNTHSDHAIKKLLERVEEGQPIDVQDLYGRFTLDAATEFLFGNCVDTLSAPLPYSENSGVLHKRSSHMSDQFAIAFTQAQNTVSIRARIGALWPLWELWGNKTTGYLKTINKFIDPILEQAMQKKGEKKSKTPAEGEAATLLDHLISVSDDIKVIRDELLNILLAGRDTTAATLTFVTYFLAMHPDVAKRLRQEVLDIVGPNKAPTIADIREMKFMRAVLNETLRLMPAVPFNIRQSIKSTTWKSKDGKVYYIPADTPIIYSVWIMHREKEYWGPDADEFDPDRFLDERLKKYLTANNFIFLPFNAGPRICLGQQFAYNESSFFLVKLLQKFSAFSLAPEAQPKGTTVPADWAKGPGRKGIEKFWPKSHLTLYAEGGLWVEMTKAVNADVV